MVNLVEIEFEFFQPLKSEKIFLLNFLNLSLAPFFSTFLSFGTKKLNTSRERLKVWLEKLKQWQDL